MSDFISRSALIKKLREKSVKDEVNTLSTTYTYKELAYIICNIPTFDTEKIISGLEEEKDIAYADFDKYVNDYELDLDSDYDDLFHKGIERAINVIRKGRVE